MEQVRIEQSEGVFGCQDSGHPSSIPAMLSWCHSTLAPPPPHIPPGTHSLHRLMMPVFFFAFNVLLADSESGSISHDSP